LVPILRTLFRLCFQYRRQHTTPVNGFPSSTLAAVSVSKNSRIGTSVESHQVGAQMTTKSYGRSVTTSGMPICARRCPNSTGIVATTSRNGLGIGNCLKRFS
jgi:hypothetical protein